MLKISTDDLEKLFTALSGEDELYMPIEKDGEVQYHKWSSGQKARFDKINTVKSAKDLFFPQSENLVSFKMEKQKIEVVDDRDSTAPFVVMGVRACDAASFGILDRVFLADPEAVISQICYGKESQRQKLCSFYPAENIDF